MTPCLFKNQLAPSMWNRVHGCSLHVPKFGKIYKYITENEKIQNSLAPEKKKYSFFVSPEFDILGIRLYMENPEYSISNPIEFS